MLSLLLAAAFPTKGNAAVELIGNASPEGLSNQWHFALDHGGENWSAAGFLTVEQEDLTLDGLVFSGRLDYDMSFGTLQLFKGRPHLTEPSVFRIVHRNNFTADTGVFLGNAGAITLGAFRKMPIKDRLAGGSIVMGEGGFGPLELLALYLHYDTGYNAALDRLHGRLWVLQGDYSGTWLNSTAAVGFLESDEDRLLQGVSFGNQFVNGRTTYTLDLMRVEPGFESLFASTNRLTPNRQGWEFGVAHRLDRASFELRYRRHRGVEGGRLYPRFTAKAGFAALNLDVELRLQPTEALVIKWKGNRSSWQFDPIRRTFGSDWKSRGMANRLSADLSHRIFRLQTEFSLLCQWRLVYKRDFLHDRSNFSARARVPLEGGFFQLEWGEYDRGNLRAAFDRPLTWRISWECRF